MDIFASIVPVFVAVIGFLLTRLTGQLSNERVVARITSQVGKSFEPDEAARLIVAIKSNLEGDVPTSSSAGQPLAAERSKVSARLVETLVDSYHRQALDQARFQFWFSVVAATIGFAWILGAGAMAITQKDLVSFAKIIPGTVIEAVALLFLKQAEQTRQRATALYDRLLTDNLNTQAIEIVSSIEDATLRSAVRAQLALHIVGMAAGAFDVGRFLGPRGPSTATDGNPDNNLLEKNHRTAIGDGEKTHDAPALKVAAGGKS